MPPLGQYFARRRGVADEPISAPKQAPFPHPSICGLTMRFAATRRGRRGCDDRPPSPPVGEGHAPVGAVLLASAISDTRLGMTKPFLLVQLSDPHIGATWAGGDPAAG